MKHESIRVMIVDDHKMVRETWRMLLEDYKELKVIKECSSGSEAINEALHLDPHIILMDINMAPVNGFEATKKIVSSSPDIKIIGISVNNQPVYAKNILEMGARGYVTKNSSREEMYHAISEVMNGRTYICNEVLQKMS